MPDKIYPWGEWMKMVRFRLRKGTDYNCSTSSMVQQIRNAASKRGRRVSIQEDPKGLFVTVKRKEKKVCR